MTTTRLRRCIRALGARLLLAGALLLASATVGGCAHTLGEGAVGLRVECNLPDATVWIDDLLAGSAKEWKSEGHQLRAGFHRIEIRHPGYYSFFQEVDLPPGSRTVVNAKLRETLD
jgi:hypothetical protein